MKKHKTTHFMAGILMLVFVGIFLVLTGRFLYIQVTGEIDGVSLEKWAEEKRTASYTIDSERGKIYDKNGMTLAYDRPTFRMYAIVDKAYTSNPEEPKHVDNPEKTAELLAPLLDLEEEEIRSTIEDGIKDERFQVEFGKEGKELSQQKRDEIAALNLPGIKFEKEPIRYYPNGVFASHILGFARETEKETENGVKREITGIAGMEKEMNNLLSGKDGHISYQRDKYNKKLLDPSEVITKPEDGDDVYLTIDQKIQTLLEDSLSQVEEEYNPERITAVVMDPKTGEIVAMGNRPSYNPNSPSDVENWYNDVVSTPVEAGSTVKMFTWASAIEEGVYNGNETYKSGSYRPNEQIQSINDHNGGRGWGIITYDEGFQRSSNVAAAKLAWEKIGTDKFLEYLKAFDLDKETGIDLPNEVAGRILYNYSIEKITTSFGQGSTLTPIQQLKAASAIANDGKMMQPYVMKKIVNSTTGKNIKEKSPNVVGNPISKETSDKVLKLLESVVNGEHGTGKMYQIDDYTVGGKTGTAQIPNPESSSGAYLSGKENHIFSFLGMAPIEDPQLMIYVSVKKPELEPTETGSMPVSFIFTNVMENSLHYLNIDPDKDPERQIEEITIPELIGKPADKMKKTLTDKGLQVTVAGKGTITDASVKQGDKVLVNDHIILVTDKPVMPSIIGWSLRDVIQIAELLELKIETFGNGYTVTQNIKAGTPLKKGDYLGVEFKPPTKENAEGESQEETSGAD
ncbi:penicillin-binding protein [Virgibacillus halodenitrificans]|uniref:penicillin-binding protein n=1 Tax=Virgibacillus halodenitrificans TaxID=1482 RepID=UPI0002FCFDCF|nr:penicillin-binding protein [Virgibacillus halodenitrificans]